jgi:hypothetical protein
MELNSLTRRHTKAERHAFGAMITIPPPRAILAARTPAWTLGTVAPDLLHEEATATRTARTARKPLGWMMAASAAAQESEATSLAATKARLTTRQGGKTAKASHVVVGAAHVDTLRTAAPSPPTSGLGRGHPRRSRCADRGRGSPRRGRHGSRGEGQGGRCRSAHAYPCHCDPGMGPTHRHSPLPAPGEPAEPSDRRG